MREVLLVYQLPLATWICISSLLTIGIYFKFRRFWSLRNLDLIGLIAYSPGLLMLLPRVGERVPSSEQEHLAYLWLFSVGGFFLLRLLLDPVMVRRPLLEPNLNASGLTFTGAAMLVFLMTNVATTEMSESDLKGARRLEQVVARQESLPGETDLTQHGPGYPFFYTFARFANRAFIRVNNTDTEQVRIARVEDATARTTAILAHLALVLGMVLIGYRHFGSIHTGVAVATLYLLLPYTAQMTGRVDQVLPAALLVWAVAAYRRPIVAGILLGSAAGVIYYPLFLLPLWCSFYWRRGLLRFSIGVTLVLVLLVGSLAFTSSSLESLTAQLRQMFGWTSLVDVNLAGFWEHYEPPYRIPVVVAFAVLCASMAIWPAQKNLGTLLSCSAAVMLGTQFWHPHYGGIYMAWYLPLLVLTIFRPNLEDRVAQSAVFDLRIRWRRSRPERVPAAAPAS